MSILYLVIPCYNEQEVLEETTKRLTDKMSRMIAASLVSKNSKIMYVDDGSTDGTWDIIQSLNQSNPYIMGVKLSRNRGHQNALLAGLMTAKDRCDCAISMDADLQDDIEVLDQFIESFQEGCDIVYGVRSNRETDTAFKRSTAQAFYKLVRFFGVEVVYNHADYRLMSARALEDLSSYKEVNLFLRGIVPQLGYRTATVEYERGERYAGESKYPLHKMVGFAVDGITSFSIKPLRLITAAGGVVSVVSAVFLVIALIKTLAGSPFTSLAVLIGVVCFLGGLQLLAIATVGAYVGRTYLESKQRPRYVVETILPSKKNVN